MIHAVIVTYNPNFLTLESEVNSLIHQVSKIWIVDNSLEKSISSWLKITYIDPKICYLPMGRNVGIGAAQNVGITQATENGARYVLLMDQDSLPYPDMVIELLRAIEQTLTDETPIAAVGPSYADKHEGTFSGFVRLGWFRSTRHFCTASKPTVEADFLISSGSLIPVNSFKNIGSMSEDFFIDHVDTEWCFRAKTKGYKLLGVCGARMIHALGDNRRRFWFLRWRNISFHAPFRYYYIFRNSILLQKMSAIPMKWRANEFVRCCKLLVFYSIFSSQRIACLRMIGRGIRDGLSGNTGKLTL